MPKKIIVTSKTCINRVELRNAILSELQGFEVVFADESILNDSDKLVAIMDQCSSAIVGRERMGREQLKSFSKIKIISKYGVGLDNIDLNAASEFGIKISWVPGVNAKDVAEHALGMMISLSRNLISSDRLLRVGQWVKDGGVSLRERKVGIIGCGHVGSELTRLLHCLGSEILINDIESKDKICSELQCRQVQLGELLEQADIISLHVPLTSETRGLISEAVLREVLPHVIIINTARGEVLNLDDCYSALKSGIIGGLGLDVFDPEPMTNHPIFSEKNAMCTPHTAGNSRQATLAMAHAACQGIREFFE